MGAQFTVWMPLSDRDRLVVKILPTTGEYISGLRILTVDDDVESLTAFAKLLRLEGATVDTATSATLALDLLANCHYDLLISDISMPGQDGYAFIERVHRDWPSLALQSIALSGFGRTVDKTRAREAGFDAHLDKPASMEDLRNVLAVITQRAFVGPAVAAMGVRTTMAVEAPSATRRSDLTSSCWAVQATAPKKLRPTLPTGRNAYAPGCDLCSITPNQPMPW